MPPGEYPLDTIMRVARCRRENSGVLAPGRDHSMSPPGYPISVLDSSMSLRCNNQLSRGPDNWSTS